MRYECGQCGAALDLEGVRTATCPYCASPSFVERPAGSHHPDPTFVLAFSGDAAWARERLGRWIGRRVLIADPALAKATALELRGVYLPAYLYSAVARTDYTASIGEHYTEVETYTKTAEDGTKTTETRNVTRTEYRHLAGEHLGYVTDLLVSASIGLPHATFERIEPFDLRQLRRYSPTLISGWIQEEFSREATECRGVSRTNAIDSVGDELRRFLPGDSHADLDWQTRVEWESLDPVLVPVWVFAVRYRPDRAPVRVVINGQTGKVTGQVPLSWWKIALLALGAAAIVLAIVVLILHFREPPP
ncbi:hypothetical protein BH11MYX3_BH11MYX3_25960 [soil metagenome]